MSDVQNNTEHISLTLTPLDWYSPSDSSEFGHSVRSDLPHINTGAIGWHCHVMGHPESLQGAPYTASTFLSFIELVILLWLLRKLLLNIKILKFKKRVSVPIHLGTTSLRCCPRVLLWIPALRKPSMSVRLQRKSHPLQSRGRLWVRRGHLGP